MSLDIGVDSEEFKNILQWRVLIMGMILKDSDGVTQQQWLHCSREEYFYEFKDNNLNSLRAT